jgi:hypothetical protein
VRYSTWVMTVSFAIVALLPFLLSSTVGEAAIPTAMLFSAALLNPILALLTLRRTAIHAYAPVAIVLGAAAAVLMIGVMIAGMPDYLVALVSALAAGVAGPAFYAFATNRAHAGPGRSSPGA